MSGDVYEVDEFASVRLVQAIPIIASETGFVAESQPQDVHQRASESV